VAVSVRRNLRGVELSVSDSGPGIPDAECENIFKRFYRLEQSRTATGNGLGLSIVAAVADLHGAKIRASSNNPGLKIAMHFPIAQDAAA
jgi:signal transduction histidine kinase